MAELSNQLLPVAVLLYLAAMMCYLAEYAFGRRGAVARAATRPALTRELIGAGGPPVTAPVSPAPPATRVSAESMVSADSVVSPISPPRPPPTDRPRADP